MLQFHTKYILLFGNKFIIIYFNKQLLSYIRMYIFTHEESNEAETLITNAKQLFK